MSPNGPPAPTDPRRGWVEGRILTARLRLVREGIEPTPAATLRLMQAGDYRVFDELVNRWYQGRARSAEKFVERACKRIPLPKGESSPTTIVRPLPAVTTGDRLLDYALSPHFPRVRSLVVSVGWAFLPLWCIVWYATHVSLVLTLDLSFSALEFPPSYPLALAVFEFADYGFWVAMALVGWLVVNALARRRAQIYRASVPVALHSEDGGAPVSLFLESRRPYRVRRWWVKQSSSVTGLLTIIFLPAVALCTAGMGIAYLFPPPPSGTVQPISGAWGYLPWPAPSEVGGGLIGAALVWLFASMVITELAKSESDAEARFLLIGRAIAATSLPDPRESTRGGSGLRRTRRPGKRPRKRDADDTDSP